MLADRDAATNLAVRDLKVAKKFYEETLGLKPVGREGEHLIAYRSGVSTLLVYKSQYAGSNKATAATWTVGAELEDIVRTLKAKGVLFEHYNLPGMNRKGDIHVAENMRAAWFKDPDGNILSLVSG